MPTKRKTRATTVAEMSTKRKTRTTTIVETPRKYEYRTINDLSKLNEPSGAKWCLYGVVKFRRKISENCMLIGLCDPTSYGKGAKGASCLLYHESFAGSIVLPVDIELGQIIRLHRMKITSYRPESGCIQLKSSNYYSWLLFDGKDDRNHDPIAQSSLSYTFTNDDRDHLDELRQWLLSFGDNETLHTELDFQFVLPEPKTFNDQSTQTNENEICDRKLITTGIMRRNSESLEYFSASDDDEEERSGKRFRTSDTNV